MVFKLERFSYLLNRFFELVFPIGLEYLSNPKRFSVEIKLKFFSNKVIILNLVCLESFDE